METDMQGVRLWPHHLNRIQQTIDREPMDLEGPDCLIKTKQRDNLITGPSSLWFLPSASNVKVKRFNQAQVYLTVGLQLENYRISSSDKNMVSVYGKKKKNYHDLW